MPEHFGHDEPDLQGLMRKAFIDAIEISVGSLSPTVNWRDLNGQEFDLPPLDEQKRIANLIWATERHKAALETAVDSVRETLARVTASRLTSLPTTVRLGDLAKTRSGPSFAASDVHDQMVPGSVPVLGIPNTKPDGTVDLDVSFARGWRSTSPPMYR